ncbi:MAG TPA: hypothetical protein VHX88_01125 [Solirubrobacteraceae bacterium]|nr:hypothetical protein [Solirubrobacteraceae bacterium]
MATNGSRSRELNAALAQKAREQYGWLLHEQLLAADLGQDAIDHRVRTGVLFRVRPRLYALGWIPVLPEAWAMAAVLAAGPAGALGGASAAALWGLQRWTRPFHVIAPSQRRPNGVVIHRQRLHADERTVHRGIPVVKQARLLLDLAPTLDQQTLTRMANQILVEDIRQREAILLVLERHPRAPGCGRLREAIIVHGAPSRSVFEQRFVPFCRHHRLPVPALNQRVAGYLVDAVFPEARVAVELDGRAFHDTPMQFERDREKYCALTAKGVAVYPLTWSRLVRQPALEAERLRAVISGRARLFSTRT